MQSSLKIESSARVESLRKKVSLQIPQGRKAELGQFLTPRSVAAYMAGLFTAPSESTCRLLDAGAGIGSLTSAFLDHWRPSFKKVEVSAFEIDPKMRTHLHQTLAAYDIDKVVYGGDFIEQAAALSMKGKGGYTHAILNPPYKKINSHSDHRLTLRKIGIETVNLYSAFVALALELMAPGGQLVAIIPRSFCNGPYYRPFRDFIFKHAAIRHMHLFDSRNKAFREDEVLQENIILFLCRDEHQGEVTVSTSTDDTFSDLLTNSHPFDRIVMPDDPERFIHVPTTTGHNAIELSGAISHSLQDLGLKVSTGPVVDFRLKEHLLDTPEPGSVPLLYPGHFAGQTLEWPKPGSKKPNAIKRNADTEKWLLPNGFYCVVRRFSAKEEKRRLVASVVNPNAFKGTEMIGLENHLNVFHEDKHGMPEALARGLAMFLNTTAMDEHFRRFNGHTQVNATDLKVVNYPDRRNLVALGEWAMRQSSEPSQAAIDAELEKLIA